MKALRYEWKQSLSPIRLFFLGRGLTMQRLRYCLLLGLMIAGVNGVVPSMQGLAAIPESLTQPSHKQVKVLRPVLQRGTVDV